MVLYWPPSRTFVFFTVLFHDLKRFADKLLWIKSAVHLKSTQLWGQLYLWSPHERSVPLPLPFFTCFSTSFIQLPAAFSSCFLQDYLALQYHRGGPPGTVTPGLVLLTHVGESSYCWGSGSSPPSPSTLALLWLLIILCDNPVKILSNPDKCMSQEVGWGPDVLERLCLHRWSVRFLCPRAISIPDNAGGSLVHALRSLFCWLF